MHQQFLRLGWVTALASVLSGCSAAEDPLAARQAVLGGEPTFDSHSGVLYVTSEVRNIGGAAVVKIGSGALLAPNLLVTALHVVSQNPSNVPFTCDTSGSATSGSSGASLGATVSADKVTVYAGPEPTGPPLARGERIISTGSTTICQNDLAFVVLDAPLDLPLYGIHRGEPVAAGDSLTAVGFGSGLDSSRDTAVRSEREVDVVAVGQWVRTFTVTVGPCEGDSGGPALSSSGELVGVFSSVALDCTSSAASPKYTDVSYFRPLVERAFEAAGAGPPWPSEGDGSAGAAGFSGAASEVEPPATPPRPDDDDAGCSFRQPHDAGGACLAMAALGVVFARRVGVRRRT